MYHLFVTVVQVHNLMKNWQRYWRRAHCWRISNRCLEHMPPHRLRLFIQYKTTLLQKAWLSLTMEWPAGNCWQQHWMYDLAMCKETRQNQMQRINSIKFTIDCINIIFLHLLLISCIIYFQVANIHPTFQWEQWSWMCKTTGWYWASKHSFSQVQEGGTYSKEDFSSMHIQ